MLAAHTRYLLSHNHAHCNLALPCPLQSASVGAAQIQVLHYLCSKSQPLPDVLAGALVLEAAVAAGLQELMHVAASVESDAQHVAREYLHTVGGRVGGRAGGRAAGGRAGGFGGWHGNEIIHWPLSAAACNMLDLAEVCATNPPLPPCRPGSGCAAPFWLACACSRRGDACQSVCCT